MHRIGKKSDSSNKIQWNACYWTGSDWFVWPECTELTKMMPRVIPVTRSSEMYATEQGLAYSSDKYAPKWQKWCKSDLLILVTRSSEMHATEQLQNRVWPCSAACISLGLVCRITLGITFVILVPHRGQTLFVACIWLGLVTRITHCTNFCDFGAYLSLEEARPCSKTRIWLDFVSEMHATVPVCTKFPYDTKSSVILL